VTDGARRWLETSTSFLDACDLAFQVIEQDDPAELEIVRATGEKRESVWSYRRGESPADMA
jgi:hypothetical protein